MNIYAAFALFALIILLYWIFTELFTIMFRFTGLSDERARFQVISLLTGTGFTTQESELIAASRRRRTLARMTMLFGYVFNITIVTAFINLFLSLNLSEVEHMFGGLLIPLTVIVLIFLCMRVPSVRAWESEHLQRIIDKYFLKQVNYNTVLLLDYLGAETITQVTLKKIPEEFQGVPLSKTGLRTDTGILVLLIEHNGEKPKPATAETVFEVGDKVTVFGNYSAVCKTFHAKEYLVED